MTSTPAKQWQFWIDRGGTFTDVVACRPDGSFAAKKLLSHDPEHYEDAARHAIRSFLGVQAHAAIPVEHIASVKMGTTVTTNALLERKGDRTVLVTHLGFGDALRIGDQHRPEIFARHIVLPELLYERVVELRGRLSAAGEELQALELEDARQGLRAAYDAGIRSCAIVLMHAYRYPQHERAVAELAREIGFDQVSVSNEVSSLPKWVSRGDTTVVDAYLKPLLSRYVDGMARHLGPTQLLFMQSNGGLVRADSFRAKDSILSGPAGGIVGAAVTSRLAGFDRVITFDMGGTSTDVALVAGEFERCTDTDLAGVRLRVPMLRIHTVAAGGGSVCQYRGGRFQVGPESAGAVPGPASYRRGGPLTVTDCNLLLGRIHAEAFPKVFGPNADESLDADVVRSQFAELAGQISQDQGQKVEVDQVADGFLQIAVENMANAIKKISVQRGHDATKYTLCCFGGAGGQHACMVADVLGMDTVFVHGMAGVLSAYGMGLADLRWLEERGVESELGPECHAELEAEFEAWEARGVAQMRDQGIADEHIRVLRRLAIRYQGSDTSLAVDFGNPKSVADEFARLHRERFGFVMPDKALIVASFTVEVIGATGLTREPEPSKFREGPPVAGAKTSMYCAGAAHEIDVFARDALQPGDVLSGPTMIYDDTATTIVEPGWQAELADGGQLVLRRVIPRRPQSAVGTEADPIMLEVFNNQFMAIAEQMGVTLANTAHSVNIKERLDFSCALFDRAGELVANAPHVPVHLGSMGQSVQTVIARNAEISRGDVFVLNDPYHGGTHLPDLTVVTPVFIADQEGAQFYVASRGHHADIGGTTPGSIPPYSQSVTEEGVLIDNFKLVDAGCLREQAMVELLTAGPLPARSPQQNLADLRAQIAANETGVRQLQVLVDNYALATVHAYMQHIQDNAEECVRRVIDRLQDGRFDLKMDDGGQIAVAVTIDHARRCAEIDFAGTSPQRPSNLNAPRSVCEAAVLYVFRCLVGENIPLNAGCMRPLDLQIPPDSMLCPSYPAAVVGGNVETSQAVTDALFAALGALAASQGTMNNFSFGNARHQYYETICGGAGAGPGFAGASAVQTHMTNSRITDPEVLESRFPVVLERFAIRRGSGGQGRFHGGDGVVRRIRFCEAMSAGILANRRSTVPFGLCGGEAGQPGRSWVERVDGREELLSHAQQVEMQPGDVFVIETPGGGGYGAK